MSPIRETAGAVRLGRTRWSPMGPNHAPSPKRRSVLKEIERFGANPGSLRMLAYAPPGLPPGSPLVVVLHGCAQDASGYEAHAGWTALADEFGFAVLYPEQKRGNNPAGCFNWFLPADSVRGLGEARSIREMIATLTETAGLDPDRVFVTGLSAGGAMATALLAAYPDVFAAGAVIAGMPCGAAAGVKEALAAMTRPHARSDAELGDAVRAGAPYDGVWPRISIWHGLADRTVSPDNAGQLVRQWLDVHGLDPEAFVEERSGGTLRRVWRRDGRVTVELTTIDGMGHGTPLDARLGERSGPFMLDVGVSSTRAIGNFFGLAGTPLDLPARQPGGVAASGEATPAIPAVLEAPVAGRSGKRKPAPSAAGALPPPETAAPRKAAADARDETEKLSPPTESKPQRTRVPAHQPVAETAARAEPARAVEVEPKAVAPKVAATAGAEPDDRREAPPAARPAGKPAAAPETVVSFKATRSGRNQTAFDLGLAIRKALKAAGLMR